MSVERLYRIGGGAAAIGALIVIGATVGRLPFAWNDFNNPAYVAATLLQMAGTVLVLMGLPSIAVFMARRSPALGVATYVTIWIPGAFLDVASNFLNISIGPYLLAHGGMPKEMPALFMAILLASIAVFVVGGIVVGVGIIRTKVFPAWVGALMLLAVGCEFVPIDVVKNGVAPSLLLAAVSIMGWLAVAGTRPFLDQDLLTARRASAQA